MVSEAFACLPVNREAASVCVEASDARRENAKAARVPTSEVEVASVAVRRTNLAETAASEVAVVSTPIRVKATVRPTASVVLETSATVL